MKKLLIKLLSWLLENEMDTLRSHALNDVQKRGMFALMWQNDSVRLYLDERERYLIDGGMERFIEGKLEDSRGLAGQLIEIRNMRMQMKACHAYVSKEREEKKQHAVTVTRPLEKRIA